MFKRWCELYPNCNNEPVVWIVYNTKTIISNIDDVRYKFMRSKKSKLQFYQNLMKHPQLFDEFLLSELLTWKKSINAMHPISDVRIVP